MLIATLLLGVFAGAVFSLFTCKVMDHSVASVASRERVGLAVLLQAEVLAVASHLVDQNRKAGSLATFIYREYSNRLLLMEPETALAIHELYKRLSDAVLAARDGIPERSMLSCHALIVLRLLQRELPPHLRLSSSFRVPELLYALELLASGLVESRSALSGELIATSPDLAEFEA